MGLGETAHTVIEDSGTLSVCKPSESNLPLSEYDDSKTAEREGKVMPKLWHFMEQDCRSAQKKTLCSQETTVGIPHYHLGSAPSASKCKPKAHVYVMTHTGTTVNVFATWSQTFYFTSGRAFWK